MTAAHRVLSLEVLLGPMEGLTCRQGASTTPPLVRVGRVPQDPKTGEPNHFVLEGGSGVSARHAQVLLEKGRILIRDLGSTNGTFARGSVVSGDVELSPGEAFVVSLVPIRVATVPAPAAPPELPRLSARPEDVPAAAALLRAAAEAAVRRGESHVDTRHLCEALLLARAPALDGPFEAAGWSRATALGELWRGGLFPGDLAWLSSVFCVPVPVASAGETEPTRSPKVDRLLDEAWRRAGGWTVRATTEEVATQLLLELLLDQDGLVGRWLAFRGLVGSAATGVQAEADRLREEAARREREEEDRWKRNPADAVRHAGFRAIDSAHPWYPGTVTPEQTEEARQLGVPLAIEHEASGVSLVLIPGGTYWMGAGEGDGDAFRWEKPRHRVKVEPFYAGVAPVLQEQWMRLTGGNPSGFRGDRRPVDNVSWNDVKEVVRRVGGRLRLSTEAEWERAARGGLESRYWWGDEWRDEEANSERGGPGRTTEVGTYPANPYGLLDVLGNVWEWCEDVWHDGFDGAPADGSAWERNGADRVLRGGSWDDRSLALRVSSRDSYFRGGRFFSFGVRLFRDASFP